MERLKHQANRDATIPCPVSRDGFFQGFFLRDGIISVADYNSTRVGVVVVVVVVAIFTMG